MLAGVFIIGAILCLIYFLVIVVYSGIGTSYIGIWLLFAGMLFASAGFFWHVRRYPEKASLRIPVTLITLCASGVVIFLILFILIFGNVPPVAVQDLDYIIVLGAQVRPEGVSKILKERLDKAAEYAAQNPYTMLILSGGQGRGEEKPEAISMQEYLLKQGVPKDQMLLEVQSRNTVENLTFSRQMITERRQKEHETQEKEWAKKNLTSGAPGEFWGMKIQKSLNNTDSAFKRSVRVGIVTSNFHLFRAEMIAKKQGGMDIFGIAAPSDPVLLMHMTIRDALAILKDRLVGNL